MKYYFGCIKKYATFEGRASRKEYWMFVLFNMLFSSLAAGLGMLLGFIVPLGVLVLPWLFTGAYSLFVLLPSVSALVRRLHDTGKSGGWFWMVLIPIAGPIIILVYAVTPGQLHENGYGPMPIEYQGNAIPLYDNTVPVMPVMPVMPPVPAPEPVPMPMEQDFHTVASFPEETVAWDPPAGVSANENAVRLSLVGANGALAGLEYEIFENGHTIGRDLSSTIRYPADEKGVSRQHCRVFWHNGALMIMDMNSSGGTFVQGKGRIPAGVPVPLSENDLICLGSQNNTLQFRVMS